MSGTMGGPLIPAQVVPQQQPMGGGSGMSPLAAAIMGHGSPMPQGGSPLGGIPLSSISMALQSPEGQAALNSLKNGVGNIFSGYNWNGMPGAPMMNGLSQQAAGNVAGGAPGL